MKKCSKCGVEKPLEAFSQDKGKSDGLQSYCKDCSRAQKREYYKANRAAVLEQQREYRESNRAAVLAQKREYSRRLLRLGQDYWQRMGADPDRCIYCLKPVESVDHIIPRSWGGKDLGWNLVPLLPIMQQQQAKIRTLFRGCKPA